MSAGSFDASLISALGSHVRCSALRDRVCGACERKISHQTGDDIVAIQSGGRPRLIARIVADRLSQSWGQQVTVMNKVGGLGSVAFQAVTVSPAGRHTLVVCIASTFIVWPEMQKSAAIELQREITPVGLLGVQPMIIAAEPDRWREHSRRARKHHPSTA